MDYQKYPITWYVDIIRLGKRGRKYLSLGICGYSKKVSHLAVINPNKPIGQEFLKVLVVRDVIISNNECEDARYCINLSCPYNKASIEYFKKYGAKTKEDVKKLHEKVEEFREKLNLEPKPLGTLVHFEEPAMIMEKERKK